MTSEVKLLVEGDRKTVDAFLRRGPVDAHMLADLGSFIWAENRWWGLEKSGALEAVVCLIEGALFVPVLCAASREGDHNMVELIRAIETEFPPHMLVQAPAAIENVLPEYSRSQVTFEHKMTLFEPQGFDDQVTRLSFGDLDQIQRFLQTAYLEDEADTRFFEPYMLEAWPHVAIINAGEIVAFGGTHIFSRETGAAGIGNIVTHPDYRGRGFAGRITRSLCASLREQGAECIGLNVAEENRIARNVYEKAGFTLTYRFEEYLATLTPRGPAL